MSRTAAPILLSCAEHATLAEWVKSNTLSDRQVLRAKIILKAGDGTTNQAIATELGTTRPTVQLWRDRFLALRLAGLEEEFPRSGRKPRISPAKIRRVVQATLHSKPSDATHWSGRSMARAQGLSESSIRRIWQQHNLKPHLIDQDQHQRSGEEKTDVLALYLNPPDRALVLGTNVQIPFPALDYTPKPDAPVDLPSQNTMLLVETLNLFEDATKGNRMALRYRHQQCIRFLKKVDIETLPDLQLYLLVENRSTYRQQKVQSWLKRHPRFHLHLVPTSCSWLNMIEHWFREIITTQVQQGLFSNINQVITAVLLHLKNRHQNPQVFIWSAPMKKTSRKESECKEISDAKDRSSGTPITGLIEDYAAEFEMDYARPKHTGFAWPDDKEKAIISAPLTLQTELPKLETAWWDKKKLWSKWEEDKREKISATPEWWIQKWPTIRDLTHVYHAFKALSSETRLELVKEAWECFDREGRRAGITRDVRERLRTVLMEKAPDFKNDSCDWNIDSYDWNIDPYRWKSDSYWYILAICDAIEEMKFLSSNTTHDSVESEADIESIMPGRRFIGWADKPWHALDSMQVPDIQPAEEILRVLGLGGTELVQMAKLESPTSQTETQSGEIQIEPGKSPDYTWADVKIAVIDNSTLRIEVQGKLFKKLTSEGAGFWDKKARKPNVNWYLLLHLAETGSVNPGTYTSRETKSPIDVKAAVKNIRRRLEELVALSDCPIKYDYRDKVYRVDGFALVDRQYGGRGAADMGQVGTTNGSR